MPYTSTTWSTLQSQLSARLQDTSNIFWTAIEIPIYLTEAFRTFAVLSAFWRSRITAAVSVSVPFYDLTTLASPTGIIDFTVTDQSLVQQIQFMLCESASSQTVWPGTSQFTLADVVSAIQRRRNQFLADTGIVVSRSTQAVASPPIGRETLSDTIIDVRRAAWVGAPPFAYYSTLWRSDERELVLANSSWNANSSTPTAYSVLGPPPLQLQLAPPPVASGQLDLLTVNTGPDLTSGGTSTVLGIPDDLTPAVMYGALADLLGMDGLARDTSRAQFCESRYQQFVQLARLLPLVVNAEINGLSIVQTSLFDLDAAVPNFQDILGTPAYFALAGWNMGALYPVPDSNGPYSLTLDVVQKAPIPSNGGVNIQLGREQLDMILDYAEHLALFKVGGYEFAATERQAQNFLLQSITYNQRLSASAKYIIAPKESSQREKWFRQRRQQADGLGALPSITDAQSQSFVKGNAPVRLKGGF